MELYRSHSIFSNQDVQQLKMREIALNEAKRQFKVLKNGVPFLSIVAPATINNGITKLDNYDNYIALWDKQCEEEVKVVKFTPASGAATRMFKELLSFSEEDGPLTENIKALFEDLKDYPFYDQLEPLIKDIDRSTDEGKKEVVNLLLEKKGLNYKNLPKGLLVFHKYENEFRTAFEEHIEEGCLYAMTADRKVNLHFTVSLQFLSLFETLEQRIKEKYEQKHQCEISIKYSVQEKSTDTIALDVEKEQPFKKKDDSLLLRPGGHGALIHNLNNIKSDYIFIKNIDNVVPDKGKELVVYYKKALAGILVEKQQKIFERLRAVTDKKAEKPDKDELLSFLEKELCIKVTEKVRRYNTKKTVRFFIEKLNRPIRVCGMVRNEGDPGGGPVWVGNSRSEQLQIAEISQLDMEDNYVKDAIENSSHFNPVDIVCSTINYKGEYFDLHKFVDPETAFISHKSQDGKPLKALEHPGLWNGAMAKWTTIFVEVPYETFAPTKTIYDLLKHNQ